MGTLCSSGMVPPSTDHSQSANNKVSLLQSAHKKEFKTNSYRQPLTTPAHHSSIEEDSDFRDNSEPIPTFNNTHSGFNRSGSSLIQHKSNRGGRSQFYQYTTLLLGKGAFGSVVLAVDRNTHAKVAIKRMNKATMHSKEKYDLYAQIGILTYLEHINIVQFIDVFDTPDKCEIVMEHLSGPDLYDAIIQNKREPFTEMRAAAMFRQILSALSYMHSQGVIHRDLKPGNIVLTDRSEHACVKVIDFDNAKQLKFCAYDPQTKQPCWEKVKEMAGTVQFMAPEIVCKLEYDMSVDIWSAGCILYSLLTGRRPFNFQRERDYKQIGKDIVTCNHESLFDGNPLWQSRNLSDNATDLNKKLMTKLMTNRITARDALQHPWFHTRSEHTLPIMNLRLQQYRNKLRSGVNVMIALIRLIRNLEALQSDSEFEPFSPSMGGFSDAGNLMEFCIGADIIDSEGLRTE